MSHEISDMSAYSKKQTTVSTDVEKTLDTFSLSLEVFPLAQNAARNGLWDDAIALSQVPCVRELYGVDGHIIPYALGRIAVKRNEHSRAQEFFENVPYDTSHVFIEVAIEKKQYREALELLQEVDFSDPSLYAPQQKLSDYTYWVLEDGHTSPAEALDLVLELTSVWNNPDTAPEKLAMRDQMIGHVPYFAIKDNDFKTASRAIDVIDNWYIGPAWGGGDILDIAYEADDPFVLICTLSLIYRKWGRGRALDDIPMLKQQVPEAEKVENFANWLSESINDETDNSERERVNNLIIELLSLQ